MQEGLKLPVAPALSWLLVQVSLILSFILFMILICLLFSCLTSYYRTHFKNQQCNWQFKVTLNPESFLFFSPILIPYLRTLPFKIYSLLSTSCSAILRHLRTNISHNKRRERKKEREMRKRNEKEK